MGPFVSQLLNWVMLAFVVGIPLYATVKKVDVFDAFITGAKQGFELSVTLIPYLVAMMVAIGMLRASGFFDLLYGVLSPFLGRLGIPADILPLALMRPFSGSASMGVTAEIVHANGGDALVSKIAATMMGSTETTFYVIAVYFGAVSIRRTRHAIPAGLLADLAGIIATVLVCNYFFK